MNQYLTLRSLVLPIIKNHSEHLKTKLTNTFLLLQQEWQIVAQLE
jgi:hypothetical protein